MMVETEAIEWESEGVPRKMEGAVHGVIGARLLSKLDTFAEEHELGYVLNSRVVYDFHDGKPKISPDVSYIPYSKLEILTDEEPSVVPDLAIEIISPKDTMFAINAKVVRYQELGIQLIWIIYPDIQTVHIFRLSDGIMRGKQKNNEDELDGENVLPGFKLAIKDLFKGIRNAYEVYGR